MHLNPAWLVPLACAGGGSLALAAVAAIVRREIGELQRAMRPLRTGAARRVRSGQGETLPR